jgi:hypothetical protein
MGILRNIVWRFNRVNPSTLDEFNEKITSYQRDILKDKASWSPNQVIVNSPIVGIKYHAWLEGSSEISANEILLEKSGFFEDKGNKSASGLFQANIFAELDADNGLNFTALELMYKINRQVFPKDLGDRIYFEGLEEYEADNAFPSFLMRCGS